MGATVLGACVRTSSTLKPDPASTVTVCALPLPHSLCTIVRGCISIQTVAWPIKGQQ
ncbi:hypothetical protein QTP70_027590, partial [Hemibagrus guttatus]